MMCRARICNKNREEGMSCNTPLRVDSLSVNEEANWIVCNLRWECN